MNPRMLGYRGLYEHQSLIVNPRLERRNFDSMRAVFETEYLSIKRPE